MKNLFSFFILYSLFQLGGTLPVLGQDEQKKSTFVGVPSYPGISSATVLEGCNFNNWPNPLKGAAFSYPAPVNNSGYDGAIGAQWGCINRRGNQTWFHVKILTGGNLSFQFTNTSNVDVDGIIWGPVANANIANACASTLTTPKTCDYRVNANVNLTIANTQPGEVYTLCVLNYANIPTVINISQPSGGQVYYSQESELNMKHYLVQGNSTRLLSSRNDFATFKLCADGTKSSQFRIPTPGVGVSARIKEDPTAANAAVYGKFDPVVIANNEATFLYTHPTYIAEVAKLKLINIEIYETANPANVLSQVPLDVYRTPVLMVHGINSEAASFRTMEAILESDLHESRFLSKVEYKPTNKKSFATNSNIIPTAISQMLNNLFTNGVAVKKVDLVGHSMGGILSRLYIQSSTYRQDVNKLITINTPHSGSPVADRILDPNFPSKLRTVVCWFLPCGEGALGDLRVGINGESTIDRELNGLGRLNNPVPSHAITTKVTLATAPENSPLRKLWGYLEKGDGSPAQFTTPELLFDGTHDLVVSTISQTGGVQNSSFSTFNLQEHIGAQDNFDVTNQVRLLVRTNPEDLLFHKTAFNPANLSYTPLPPPVDDLTESLAGAVIITSPTPNQRVNVGSSLQVTASATNVTKMTLLVKITESTLYTYETTGNSLSVSVPINAAYAVGTHDLLVIGEAADGSLSSATGSFTVTNCVSGYTLNGDIRNPFYQATGAITVAGLVPFGDIISMTAGQYIDFKVNFETNDYSYLEAEIKDCN